MRARTVLWWIASACCVLAITWLSLYFPGSSSVEPGLFEALRLTGLVLIWPSLAVARLGVPMAIFALPALLVALAWRCRRRSSGRANTKLPARGYVVLLAYSFLGWVYVFVAPIPVPAGGAIEMRAGEIDDPEIYMEAFELGYRAGATNTLLGYYGITSDSFNKGFYDGVSSGQGEFARLLSPLVRIGWTQKARSESVRKDPDRSISGTEQD